MHKAGRVIFRITNGSAFFFCTRDVSPKMSNGFIQTLKKTVMLQDETSDGCVGSRSHCSSKRRNSDYFPSSLYALMSKGIFDLFSLYLERLC